MAFLVNVLLFCQLEASRDSYHPLPPTYFKRRELWYPQWRKPLLETTTRGLEGNEIRNLRSKTLSEVLSQAELLAVLGQCLLFLDS